jgi:hypothetical protein
LAHLTLVAGTAVAEVQKAGEVVSVRAAKDAVEDGVAKMEATARAVIYRLKPGLDGLSVSELLAEINRNRTDGRDKSEFITIIQRNGRIRNALLSVGIHAQSALPEDELDVVSYGLVVHPRRLLKACPELKPLKAILEGITL